MAEHLFPHFLSDALEYREAEKLWRHRWLQVVQQAEQAGCWQAPWLNTTFADGTPFQDGNPMFSAICPERQLDNSVSV